MQISSKGGGESTSVGKERACPLPSGIGVNSGSGVAWGEEGGEEDVTLSADSKEDLEDVDDDVDVDDDDALNSDAVSDVISG